MQSMSSRKQIHLRRGFSLPELLVVIGVIAIMLALIMPPLRRAREQAMQATCLANESGLGKALGTLYNDYGFYPLWDDEGTTVRYTWIDVLRQRGYISTAQAGYCPSDARPDALNEARAKVIAPHLVYPLNREHSGVDYSYGIGVPLSAGGWMWRPNQATPRDPHPRRFEDHERNTARRILLADATWSAIYNLSGDAMTNSVWYSPTQFDNTVAYRHRRSASLLFQDGHATRITYDPLADRPVDTFAQFVWHPGESLHVGPDHRYGDNWYPNVPPVLDLSNPSASVLPVEVTPRYYTESQQWTEIHHK